MLQECASGNQKSWEAALAEAGAELSSPSWGAGASHLCTGATARGVWDDPSEVASPRWDPESLPRCPGVGSSVAGRAGAVGLSAFLAVLVQVMEMLFSIPVVQQAPCGCGADNPRHTAGLVLHLTPVAVGWDRMRPQLDCWN